MEAVDRRLEQRVALQQIDAMRSVLITLTDIKATGITSGAGRRRPRRQLRRLDLIFPARDLSNALAHYESLGFVTHADDNGDEYGFANRGGVGLHLAASSQPSGGVPGSACLYVATLMPSTRNEAGPSSPAVPIRWRRPPTQCAKTPMPTPTGI